MNRLSLLLLSALIVACNEKQQSENKRMSSALPQHVVPCAFTVLDLEQPSQDKYRKLDSVEVTQLTDGLNGRLKSFPPYNRFEDFYSAGETKCDNVSIRYIIHKDESCCSTLYFFSSLTKSSHKLDCIKSAVISSDGGWEESDKLTLDKQGLLVTRHIRVDVDNPNTGDYIAINKTLIRELITVNSRGFFSRVQLDSTTSTIARNP